MPEIAVVIVNWNGAHLLPTCLESVRRQTFSEFETILVDNGSREKNTLEFLQTVEGAGEARIVRDPGDFNFSRLTNRGADAAAGDILLFLNNDIEATEPGWLREMVSHAARAVNGAVGARLWYPNGTLQHGGVVLGLGGVAGHAFPRLKRGRGVYFSRAQLQQNISAVTGACLAVRKELLEKIGRFDETNFSISFNENDFDESRYQRQMAEALGTEHHVIQMSNADIGAVFPEVIWHTEVPILRTAPAPMFLLSKLVREQGFKVVLTGEGADEFLAGYDIFKESQIRHFWARQPLSALRPLLATDVHEVMAP